MKKFFKITFGILLLLAIVFYLCVVFVLPSIINNKTTINKLQSIIHEKTSIETTITGLNFKISPKLTVILNIDSINAENNNIKVADIENLFLKYEILQKRLILVSADNIFVDGGCLKQFKKEEKKKNKDKLRPNDIPEIHVQKFVFKYDDVNINVENIDTNDNFIKLNAAVNAPFLKETLKLGDSGSLQVAENKLNANKFEITLGNSHLYLDGVLVDENKFPNLNINGEKLPISELMATVLYFQKSKDSSRRLIENLKDFKGTVKVNLQLNKDGIWGTCVANDFGAKAVMFDIPLFFKETVFNFRGETIDSVSQGIFGNEKVTNTLNANNITTPQIEIIGTVKTALTKKFNYVPNFTVLNSADINISYNVKDFKPEVHFNMDIPANSDLIFNSFYLGLRDYKRKLYAHTFKDGNDLYLREYKYSYSNSDKENVIISGDGFFKKKADKSRPDDFIPQYLTIRTNGYAPTSVIGSFGEKIRGGEFKGDLKYDFKNNQVLGTFDITNARHKAFHINQAHVVSKNGVLNVTSNGFFKGEKYSAALKLKNNIFGETLIYDMRMFLDKLVFETTPDKQTKKTKIDPNEITKKVADTPITINNWKISINEIRRDKFLLQNANLIGSMKNNVFDFKMNDLKFADGVIHANGVYDFAKNTSKMTFIAENINSDKVAEMTLNLKNQIEGIASAKVNLDAKDMFRFIDVHCIFEVKEGFLPKLDETEFMIKNSKYKLSQITNVDLSQKDLMKDDIKGSFDVHNTELKNINITTWHELSAIYLEGNYEMEKQYADLQLFWHYSKEAPKGVRIFHVPLNFILKVAFRPENSKELYKAKLQQIPKIKDNDKNSNYYRIQVKGDLNNNKIDMILKEIR